MVWLIFFRFFYYKWSPHHNPQFFPFCLKNVFFFFHVKKKVSVSCPNVCVNTQMSYVSAMTNDFDINSKAKAKKLRFSGKCVYFKALFDEIIINWLVDFDYMRLCYYSSFYCVLVVSNIIHKNERLMKNCTKYTMNLYVMFARVRFSLVARSSKHISHTSPYIRRNDKCSSIHHQ